MPSTAAALWLPAALHGISIAELESSSVNSRFVFVAASCHRVLIWCGFALALTTSGLGSAFLSIGWRSASLRWQCLKYQLHLPSWISKPLSLKWALTSTDNSLAKVMPSLRLMEALWTLSPRGLQ